MPSGERIINILNTKYPCRKLQLSQLYALLNPALPLPPTIVVYGLEATGKSLITRALLDELSSPADNGTREGEGEEDEDENEDEDGWIDVEDDWMGKNKRLSYSWVACYECITARHLTERIASTVKETILAEGENGYEEGQERRKVSRDDQVWSMRAENVNALTVMLGKILGGRGKHILVLDRIDWQREGTSILLSALARLGEKIPHLTIIFIISAPAASLFYSPSLPHVHFPPYSKDDLITILMLNPLRLNLHLPEYQPPPKSNSTRSPSPPPTESEDLEESLFVYPRFLSTVWESQAKSTARSLIRFKSVSDKLWDQFVAPIRSGEYGTRDFSKLYVKQRSLLLKEVNVVDEVILRPPSKNESTEDSASTVTTTTTPANITVKGHDLPYYSRFLLIAAYLASYNPTRHDPLFFMKSSGTNPRARGPRTLNKPNSAAAQKRITRRLLGPQPFLLERMLAIFHAIVPKPVKSSGDLLAQVATLTSLRLLMRAGQQSGGDLLDGGGGKWKVNVGWEYVKRLARSVKFEVEGFVAE